MGSICVVNLKEKCCKHKVKKVKLKVELVILFIYYSMLHFVLSFMLFHLQLFSSCVFFPGKKEVFQPVPAFFVFCTCVFAYLWSWSAREVMPSQRCEEK